MNKTLYIIYGFCGQIFVDEEAKVVHYIHDNDGNYRPEYMSNLIKYFDGRIIPLALFLDNISEDDDYNLDVEEYIEKYRRQVLNAIKKSKSKTK